MHELLDRILKASSPQQARQALTEAQAELEGQADRALETLEAGFDDATAILALPTKYRRRLRTTNMLERSRRGDPAAGEGDPDFSKRGVRP
jgi:transposase-like protein